MTQDKRLSLLGLCRRAGRLQWGHDTCLDAVNRGKAAICLLAADASARMQRDFRMAADKAGGSPEIVHMPYTMQDLQDATGVYAGVLTIEDEGFAKRLADLFKEE